MQWNKPLLFVVILIISIAVIVWLQQTVSTSGQPESLHVQVSPPQNPPKHTVQTVRFSAENLLWTRVEPDQITTQIPPLKGDVTDAVLVEYDLSLRTYEVGDTIVLHIPQIDMTYKPKIKKIKHPNSSNRTIIGHLIEGEDRLFGFVITLGEKNAFAHISTPEGSYELVGNDKVGWLMPTRNMDQDVDYSKPDYVISKPEVRTDSGQENL